MNDDVIDIPFSGSVLRLRPEREDDRNFRFQLFCDSRPAEWELLRQNPALYDQLSRHQFEAQTVSYRQYFPRARFDIIELDGEPIGRIVVNRPGTVVHIVDQAIVRALRNHGIGTTIMHAVIDEARNAGLPVRLKVASSNDPSMRLYLRLGFVPIQEIPAYIELEWNAAGSASA